MTDVQFGASTFFACVAFTGLFSCFYWALFLIIWYMVDLILQMLTKTQRKVKHYISPNCLCYYFMELLKGELSYKHVICWFCWSTFSQKTPWRNFRFYAIWYHTVFFCIRGLQLNLLTHALFFDMVIILKIRFRFLSSFPPYFIWFKFRFSEKVFEVNPWPTGYGIELSIEGYRV